MKRKRAERIVTVLGWVFVVSMIGLLVLMFVYVAVTGDTSFVEVGR